MTSKRTRQYSVLLFSGAAAVEHGLLRGVVALANENGPPPRR